MKIKSQADSQAEIFSCELDPRFGRTWIETIFWLWIVFGELGYLIFTRYNITDTFCGSLDTEPVSWFWFAGPHFVVRELPDMTSAKFCDFSTAPLCPNFMYCLYIGVFSDPPPPSVRMSYMEAPLGPNPANLLLRPGPRADGHGQRDDCRRRDLALAADVHLHRVVHLTDVTWLNGWVKFESATLTNTIT